MGEPAELTVEQRKAIRRLADEVVDSVRNDEPMLLAVHDYDLDPRGMPRTPVDAEEAMQIDSTKFGDLDASSDIELAMLQLSQEVRLLEFERETLQAACRLDFAEMNAFRAWRFANRDRVLEVALEIAKHWGEQGGVNGAYLDQLAELAGYPTRGYRRES